MIDSIIAVCFDCGAEIPAEPESLTGMTRTGTLCQVGVRCFDCGNVWVVAYGRDYFKRYVANAVRRFATGDGVAVATPEEKVLRGFGIDLEKVDGVADLQLYWRAQRARDVPKERLRA